LNGAYFSTVNHSEVLQKSEQKGLKISNIVISLEGIGLNLVSFTTEQAELTASLWKITQPYGLSLNAIAITTDKTWANIRNIQVQVIR